MIKFTWNPVDPNCPAIHYNILASNCGSCPTTTNHTTVTCTDVPTNSSVCKFSVQTVACGGTAAGKSDEIHVNLHNTLLKGRHVAFKGICMVQANSVMMSL